MRTQYLFLFVMLTSACSSPRQENPDQTQTSEENGSVESISLDDLKGEWQELTEQEDGTFIIFRPCDADNRLVQVKSDTLLIGWGQDASFALIRSFYVDEAGRVVLSVHDQDENAAKTYYMQWEDDTEPIANWFLYGLDEPPVLMAHESILGRYKKIQQPCRECWDDCEDE